MKIKSFQTPTIWKENFENWKNTEIFSMQSRKVEMKKCFLNGKIQE
jgi:hypothetical protein